MGKHKSCTMKVVAGVAGHIGEEKNEVPREIKPIFLTFKTKK